MILPSSITSTPQQPTLWELHTYNLRDRLISEVWGADRDLWTPLLMKRFLLSPSGTWLSRRLKTLPTFGCARLWWLKVPGICAWGWRTWIGERRTISSTENGEYWRSDSVKNCMHRKEYWNRSCFFWNLQKQSFDKQGNLTINLMPVNLMMIVNRL